MALTYSATSSADPVRAIIAAGPPGADGYVYNVTNDAGTAMWMSKVIDDGRGEYLAIYHTPNTAAPDGTPHAVEVASSTDLVNWHYRATLTQHGNGASIGRRGDGSFVVAFTNEGATWAVRVQRYADLAALYSAKPSDDVTLPWTLAPAGGVEQFPNVLDPESLRLGFVWDTGPGRPGVIDRDAMGTLTGLSGSNYSSWHAADDSASFHAVTSQGPFNIGDFDEVTYAGRTTRIVEAQTYNGSYGAFSLFTWNGTASRLPVRTHGGSREFGNPAVTVIGKTLVVSLFLTPSGAALGEAGPVLYWKAMP